MNIVVVGQIWIYRTPTTLMRFHHYALVLTGRVQNLHERLFLVFVDLIEKQIRWQTVAFK